MESIRQAVRDNKKTLIWAGIALLVLLAIFLLAGGRSVNSQLKDPKAANVSVDGHIVEPVQLAPTPELLEKIDLPDGFEMNVFADNLINPRMVAVSDTGTVYVTRRTVGDVIMLKDVNVDGIADGDPVVVASRPNMHGIAITGSTMYLITINDIYRTQIREDGTLGELDRIVDDLPDAGQHPNRTLTIGDDGFLYVSVGSTCNACEEANPENATMLRIAPDGSSRTIFAAGLRNTIGFGFAPGTSELYGVDHGIDWLGDNEQAEELNHIVKGKHYGWPYAYADGKLNPQDYPMDGTTIEEWAARSTNPDALYTPHAAPMQMAFYTGSAFPAEYQGDAFVAMRGSWNRKPPSGYEIVRVNFEDGKPKEFVPFATGFLMRDGGSWGHMGRLAGIAQAADGSLLLTDDTNGVIYRIAYTGEERAQNAPRFTNVRRAFVGFLEQMGLVPPTPGPTQLAREILAAPGTLQVQSLAFGSGARIPTVYAGEGQDISPAIRWSAGPEGTKSYAVVMEDPDVAEEPPFVHWLLYNLSPDTTELGEAVPPSAQVEKLAKARQGTNDRGTLGYTGPNPPPGDGAHRYSFQVFALDTVLELPHGATRTELLDAMRGHVLSSGSVIGTYSR